LITGHNGYLGSVMAPLLVRAGYDVVGLDTGFFRQCTLVPDAAQVPWRVKDIRDLNSDDLRGFDAVIHLAALSNDPIGNLDEGWTRAINFEGSVRLAVLAKAAGVKRYLFSSSCIMYGMSETNDVDEASPLDPRTEYARSKVLAEQTVSALAGDGFSPTFLRNGTLYGLSPRMRFDTVFNDLIGTGITTGRVVVYSDGKPWRPVVHVSDAARAFLEVLRAPVEKVHNQAFNVGANHLNHQVMELAEIAARTIPDCRLEVEARGSADQRTYKADFSKFARSFPSFRFRWSAEEGARELCGAFRAIGLSERQFLDKRFTRLKWLNHLLESQKLAGPLRWADDLRDAYYPGGVL
jgi:nucleoside-diphosphate-sugar epimerase